MAQTDIATDPHALTLIMALASALHTENVLPIDCFIAAIRKSALQIKATGTPGADDLSDHLLESASALALRHQRSPE